MKPYSRNFVLPLTLDDMLRRFPCWVQGSVTRLVAMPDGTFEVRAKKTDGSSYETVIYSGSDRRLAMRRFVEHERDF